MGGPYDSIAIYGSSGPDVIRLGTKGGGGPANIPVPRINLNANESSGVDHDVTLLGVEKISILAYGGRDTVSGEGGAGTGEAATLPLFLNGGDGADVLTGGTNADALLGGSGGDTLKGGKGSDELKAEDGVAGNDSSFGG